VALTVDLLQVLSSESSAKIKPWPSSSGDQLLLRPVGRRQVRAAEKLQLCDHQAACSDSRYVSDTCGKVIGDRSSSY
jgi:hypothetical protein